MPNVDKSIAEWMGRPHQWGGKYITTFSPDTNPSDFDELMKYVKGRDGWEWWKFIEDIGSWQGGCEWLTPYAMADILTDRPKFCEAVADYFVKGWREK
jgi:hypothetical protein